MRRLRQIRRTDIDYAYTGSGRSIQFGPLWQWIVLQSFPELERSSLDLWQYVGNPSGDSFPHGAGVSVPCNLRRHKVEKAGATGSDFRTAERQRFQGPKPRGVKTKYIKGQEYVHMTTSSHLRSAMMTGVAAIAAVTFAGAAQAASLAEIQDSGSMRIAVANEIPYGYIDPVTGDAAGAGPDVAKYIAEQLGVTDIEWVTTDFSSLIPGLQADRFDMVAAEMAIIPTRCATVIYSEPNTSYGEGLLVPAGNPEGLTGYQDFADNPDLTVAIMAGANQLDMMQALGVSENQLITISSNADAISTVSTGRANAYAATGLTASELAGQSDAVEVAEGFSDPIIDGEEQRSWGAFVFAQGNEELRDAVNEILAEYKQTDEWLESVSSYGFTDADTSRSFDMTTADLCAE
jgi:polar amino acid transport system substrate-binding protein